MIRFLSGMEHEETFWLIAVAVVAVALWLVTALPIAAAFLGFSALVFAMAQAREAARLKRQTVHVPPRRDDVRRS